MPDRENGQKEKDEEGEETIKGINQLLYESAYHDDTVRFPTR